MPIIIKANYHDVLQDSQNNLIKARENSSFYKTKPPRALNDISEVLEQKLYNSKDISEAHRVF